MAGRVAMMTDGARLRQTSGKLDFLASLFAMRAERDVLRIIETRNLAE
jgi:hypothetical protein